MEILWKRDKVFRERTEVMFDPPDDPVYIVNPGREPTEAEVSACPAQFRCFSCNEKRSRKNLGGRFREEWFCIECVPYWDDWTTGAMQMWEANRKLKTK